MNLQKQIKNLKKSWVGRHWGAIRPILLGFTLLVPLPLYFLWSAPKSFHKEVEELNPFVVRVNHEEIVKALGRRRITAENLREHISISLRNENFEVISSIQLNLQERIEKLYRRYNPLYAALVALDPTTGEVLALVDHSSKGHVENLALRGTFPAASVFKLVTSAAAIESGHMSSETRIPFNGSYTSLYKRNLTYRTNHWTRFIPLGDALAKSINSVFGKVAIYGVGQKNLQNYANAFGFNRPINFDMPVDISNVTVPADRFGIAESGSGYTTDQTLSPMQGALIAATVINDGKTPRPIFVTSVLDREKKPVYTQNAELIGSPISAATAKQIAMMMEKTITKGTARGSFRDYNRHPTLSKLFIGAKTGSLTGNNPQGKVDWFVGFAQSSVDPTRKIAFASLIVNGKYWRVKSAYIARQLILEYFKNLPPVASAIN